MVGRTPNKYGGGEDNAPSPRGISKSLSNHLSPAMRDTSQPYDEIMAFGSIGMALLFAVITCYVSLTGLSNRSESHDDSRCITPLLNAPK